MKNIIANIARLDLLRQSWHSLINKHSDSECFSEFIRCMNEKSRLLGMNHTKWINPSGVGEDGLYSTTTARDLTLMAIYAYQNSILNDIWYKKEKLISIKKPYIFQLNRIKNKIIQSTIPYKKIAGNYDILGAKTGSGDGYQSLVMVCKVNHHIVAGTIMNADTAEGRFVAMAELMTIVGKKLGASIDLCKPILNSAKYACAYLVEDGQAKECLYEKDADVISAPMSTTKVMTVLTALDYLDDLSKDIYISPFDFSGCNSDILYPWERLSIRDIMYAAMLASSNVAANSLTRITGSCIIHNQH